MNGELGFATVDVDRERRQGLPEVVYGPGKTPSEIAAIVRVLLGTNSGPILVTRVGREAAAAVTSELTGGVYHEEAQILVWRPAEPGTFRLSIVTAGTADGPVAAEAATTARSIGLLVSEHRDVGVAGIHRLLNRIDLITASDAVIVVAGMEGALASVVAGLVAVPVIAVPTSTGYGAALDGITALLAMLSSCAAGVTVVNIDAGFSAAMAAFRLCQVRT
jgi:NCAIR mutase (PurE)-related protein